MLNFLCLNANFSAEVLSIVSVMISYQDALPETNLKDTSPVTVYHFVAFRYPSAKYSISGSFKIVYGYIKVPLELMEIISFFFRGSLI